MEIKAELKQPYTENQRMDFIVEQNHRNGYEIRHIETIYEVEIKVPSIIKETITETIQEPVLDENGYPILDENGNPTFEEKTVEREVERTETEIITETIEVPVFDEEGNPVLDKDGNQTYETKTIEKEVTKYKTEIVEKTGYNLEAWGYTEEEKQEQERERIDMLFLTGADVERGIYQAKGMDFDDIMAFVIANPPAGLDVKALNIELKANNFYRGSEYVSKVGALLGFTSEQLDKFFETNDYHELLSEVINEDTTDTTDISNEVDTEETGAKNADTGTLE